MRSFNSPNVVPAAPVHWDDTKYQKTENTEDTEDTEDAEDAEDAEDTEDAEGMNFAGESEPSVLLW